MLRTTLYDRSLKQKDLGSAILASVSKHPHQLQPLL